MDAAGRLVLPRQIRRRAGLVPGQTLAVSCTEDGAIEVRPLTPPARIETRGRWRVALPPADAPRLDEETVGEIRRALREERDGA